MRAVRGRLSLCAGDRVRCGRFVLRTRGSVPATYKGQLLGSYRIDFVVEDLVIVEVKSVERMNPVFETQVITYLGMTGKRVGLFNFNSRLLKDGVQRIIR
jgi:GxxExxY protein